MRADKIKDGCFAAVIRGFTAPDNPKWMSFAPATRELWGLQLRLAEDVLGTWSIYEMRSSLVQKFLDGLSDKPAKQAAALSALRAVEKWALVRDLLPHPITIGCEAEGSDGGHIPWNDEHVIMGETHASPEISRAITLASNTGQRGSDLIKMRWTDIEVYNGRPGINVNRQQKTKVTIWIPMTEALMAAVATWERRPGFILLKSSGRPWKRENLTNTWRYERDTNPALAPLREVSAAGIEERGLVMHGLRGTACVRLLRAGATTRQISDMIGMSEPMVARYTRFSEQRKNATAAVLHLDRTVNELRRKDAGK